jgi:hypothetical protein
VISRTVRVGLGAIGAILLIGLLADCDPIPILSQVGLSRDAVGHTIILFVPCQGQAVRTIGVDEVVDDPATQPVWQLRNETGVWPGSVQVGAEPPGFRTTIPLRAPLVPEHRYIAWVNRSGGGFQVGADFMPAELTSTAILDGHGDKLSPSTFLAKAGKFCAGV